MQGGTAARDYRRLGGVGADGGGGGGQCRLSRSLFKESEKDEGVHGDIKAGQPARSTRRGRRTEVEEEGCAMNENVQVTQVGPRVWKDGLYTLLMSRFWKKKTAIYREERLTMSQKSSANEKTWHLENLRVLCSRRARLRRNICDCHTETRVRQTAELL